MKPRRPAQLLSARSLRSFRIVLVTVPSRTKAERLARGILSKKLASCVNLVGGVRSWYRWKGRVNSDSEFLLIIKTAQGSLRSLHRWIRDNHPDEVPEFLSITPTEGDSDYLQWLKANLS